MIFNEQTSRSVVSSPWRNRLARSAVNRKVGGSSPPGDADLICRAPPTSTLRPGRSPWRGVDLKTSTQLTHQMVRKSQHPLKVLPATRRRQRDCGLWPWQLIGCLCTKRQSHISTKELLLHRRCFPPDRS